MFEPDNSRLVHSQLAMSLWMSCSATENLQGNKKRLCLDSIPTSATLTAPSASYFSLFQITSQDAGVLYGQMCHATVALHVMLKPRARIVTRYIVTYIAYSNQFSMGGVIHVY
jgi:hypothetical protein